LTLYMALLIAAITAGVLLPKVVPAVIGVGDQLDHGRWHDFLELLPAAILAALTAVTALGSHPERGVRPVVLVAVIAAAAITVVYRALGSWRRRRGMPVHGRPEDLPPVGRPDPRPRE
jgi:branched-subunit amino acid transport protein